MNVRCSQMSGSRTRTKERGATFVEFALGFLCFIMLLLGVVEGARLVWAYTTLASATREGVRYAIVNGHQGSISNAEVQGFVASKAPGLDPSGISVTTTWENASRSGSSVIEVRAAYTLTTIAAPLLFGASSIELAHTAHGTVAE